MVKWLQQSLPVTRVVKSNDQTRMVIFAESDWWLAIGLSEIFNFIEGRRDEEACEGGTQVDSVN